MTKITGIIDRKPSNNVEDIKPKNKSVEDIKSLVSDGAVFETTVSKERTIAAGQYMGLPFLVTYPVNETFTAWENI